MISCHGTPRQDDEIVLVDSSLGRWADALSTVPAEVRTVVCGHTHMPFHRLVDRRLVVNPGSVGMPYGRPGPHWALLRDGTATLRHTELDLDAAAETTVAASTYPGAGTWVDEYVRAAYSDVEALTTFAPREDRP